MGLHQQAQGRAPAGVQRGEGLVQQPQGPRRGDQPGEGEAAALSGRQLAHLEVEQGLQRQHIDRGGDPVGIGPGPAGVEIQLLAGPATGLQAVQMAQPVDVVRPGLRRFTVDEGDRSGVRADEAGQGAQQGGLACAIGPGQGHGLAGGYVEGQVAEQDAFAAGDGEGGDGNHPCPLQLRISINDLAADVDTWTRPATLVISGPAAAGVRRARRGPVRPAVDRAFVQPDCRAA